ncbi:nucleotidyltransferase family protein [Aliiroseovarius lamellibrachiae]|uniref:nucleotidyltransferase family protein n=1 Tax=Aliiroseovarius lamellibrachiae TaxID=1924933 RepID=UPI001BE07E7E|nr:nucleotidyltransferase family protein [Aliiroseovarius lamellibrachiae]MBT2132141.1 nucleotidyltransferase family protein [Aliiroseovarius lamellibrachiae]
MSNAPLISIVVMAAGQSRRMGGVDKLLLPVRGQSLLANRVEMAAKTGRDVFVVLPPEDAAPERWSALNSAHATLIPCPGAVRGMGASLSCAFGHVKNHYDAALVLLADMPALTRDDLNLMLGGYRHGEIHRAAGTGHTMGHPVIIPKRLFPLMANLSGDQGARRVLTAEKTHFVTLPGDNATKDIDTAEQWISFQEASKNTNNSDT